MAVTVLQFSGGIDSLCMLLLLRKSSRAGAHVVTVLTDGAYPDAEQYLQAVANEMRMYTFHTVRTERYLPHYGQPVDIVPLRWTAMGQLARGTHDVRYQDAFSCCNRAIWEPLDKASRDLDATDIYRGQRNDDRLRSPLKDGDEDRGVRMHFPLADWGRQEVREYVIDNAPHLLPEYYAMGEQTSRDCLDCTAYRADNAIRVDNLPDLEKQRVNGLITRWHRDVITELENPK